MSFPQRNSWFLFFIFLFLSFLYSIFLFHQIHLPTEDLGRHLMNGKLLLSGQYDILSKNVYSYTYPEFPFPNHHWLTGVLFYLIYKSFSLPGLYLLHAGILFIALWVSLLRMVRQSNLIVSALLGFPFVLLLASRSVIRPESFGYLFMVLSLYLVDKIEQKQQFSLWFYLFLFFLQVLWVNMHISFILGIMITGTSVLTSLTSLLTHKTKRYVWKWKSAYTLFSLSVFGSLLNPQGFTGLLYPFRMFSNYGYSIVENQTVWFLKTMLPNPVITLYFFFASITLGFLFIRIKKESIGELVRVGMGMVMGWMSLRHIPIFAIVAFPFLAKAIFQTFASLSCIQKQQESLRIIGVLAVMLLYALGFSYVSSGNYYKKFGTQKMGWQKDFSQFSSSTFFHSLNIDGKFFNNFDIGGFLDFTLYPQYQVFVDNRPDAFPSSFFKDVYIPMQENDEIWKKQLEQYDFQAIFFGHTDITPWGITFLQNRLKDPEWKTVYIDTNAIILLRNLSQYQYLFDRYSVDTTLLLQLYPWYN